MLLDSINRLGIQVSHLVSKRVMQGQVAGRHMACDVNYSRSSQNLFLAEHPNDMMCSFELNLSATIVGCRGLTMD